MAEGLLYRLGILSNVEAVLCDPCGDPGHIRRLSRKDVPIAPEKLEEFGLLFLGEVLSDDHCFLWVVWVHLEFFLSLLPAGRPACLGLAGTNVVDVSLVLFICSSSAKANTASASSTLATSASSAQGCRG